MPPGDEPTPDDDSGTALEAQARPTSRALSPPPPPRHPPSSPGLPAPAADTSPGAQVATTQATAFRAGDHRPVANPASKLDENGHAKPSEPQPRPAHQSGTIFNPDMPAQDQPGGMAQRPGHYPPYSAGSATSPHEHSPSSASAQHASYPTTTAAAASTTTHDPYRASPAGGGSSVSLPSMRTIDSMAQQPPPRPSSPGGMAYYSQHLQAGPSAYVYPPEPMSHYTGPLDPAVPGSRAPKKEIKRRTKTGCLTCRKRRIKCDESRPVCNNCKKSKRHCLGYDPVLKPGSSSQPSDTSLQPAPTPAPLPLPSVHSGTSASRPVSSYSSQSSTSTHTPSVSPALAKPEPGYAHSSADVTSNHSYPASYYSSRPLDHKSMADPSHGAQLRGRKMKIEQIISPLMGPLPAAVDVPASKELLDEITNVYHEMYAAGLGAFFETGWYFFAENGKMTFPKDPTLLAQMASFLKILEAVSVTDHTQMSCSGVLETKIVWELARTVYNTPENTNSAAQSALPPDKDPTEARNRLRVVEALLCGDPLPDNPLAPPIKDPDHHRVRQFDFWFNLARFVCSCDQPFSEPAARARQDAMNKMRDLLDGRENRDLLYSICVVRHLAPNYDAAYGSTIPQHLDESDPKNRLAVASKFILDEAQVTGGTTNVVRRFADIAARAFINPGVNIATRP